MGAEFLTLFECWLQVGLRDYQCARDGLKMRRPTLTPASCMSTCCADAVPSSARVTRNPSRSARNLLSSEIGYSIPASFSRNFSLSSQQPHPSARRGSGARYSVWLGADSATGLLCPNNRSARLLTAARRAVLSETPPLFLSFSSRFPITRDFQFVAGGTRLCIPFHWKTTDFFGSSEILDGALLVQQPLLPSALESNWPQQVAEKVGFRW